MRQRRWDSVVVAGAINGCASARGVEVFTSIDGDGNRRRNEFFTDSVGVYCIVDVSSGRDDQTIEVYIRQLTNETGGATNRIVASSEGPTSKSALSRFAMRLTALDEKGQPIDDAPIPAGGFACELYIDGQAEGRAAFNVRFAPCPTGPIVPTAVCAGYFKDGVNCPREGTGPAANPTKAPANCTCSGVWTCR